MKRKLFTLFSVMLTMFSLSMANAQYYYRAPISSGFNADVVANGTGSSMLSTSTDVDGVNFTFVSQDFKLTASSTALTYGFPVSGQFTSAVTSTPGLPYEFASYSANNSLRLALAGDTGTLALTTPVAAYNVYILATSGSGPSTVDAVINFSDGTTQAASGLALANWYDATGFALQGFGRINRATDALETGSGINPRLYQIPVDIILANQTKLIQSITFTKTGTGGIPNIFAISVNKFTTCPAPSALAASAITQSGATLSWTAPATVPSNGYQFYYSTTNTTPADTATPSVTGVTGTTTPISGLTANTVYYIWGRSVCGGVPGPWGLSTNFKTLCGPVSTLNENLESYATGAIVPDCWARLISGTGTASISSTTPVASGTKHLYQISSTTANATVIVLPVLSNVNAGTNWLKFKTRASSTTGASIQVGYVTDPADATTFVSLYAFDVTNILYTDLSANRSFVIPNTVPANARLAVKNTGTKIGGLYWDDVIWETLPSCQEPYNPVKSGATNTSISLSWTAPTTAPASYDIYYSTTNTAPTSTTVPQVTGITGTSNAVSGLTASTIYYFWVRSNCGGSQSTWVGPVSGYTGTCLPSAGTSSSSYYLKTITTTGASPNINYSATAYNAYTDNSAITFSSFPSGVINYTLAPNTSTNYYYIWIDYNNDLDFDDAGETVLATTSYTASTTGSFTIPITVAPGNYRARFAQSYTGVITACGPAPYGSYVDYTLNVGAQPTCIAPTNLVKTGASVASVSLSWTAPATAPATYDIYYNTTNVSPTASTVPQITGITGTTTTVSGLTASTIYYFWVRSHCSATDQSFYAGSASGYTGACLPIAGTSSTLYYLNNITTTGGFTNIAYTASTYNAYVDNSATTFSSFPTGTLNYTLAASSGTNYYYIWVDYNNDLDFDDVGETVVATTTYATGATGSFTIPATVPSGNYRARFAQSFSGVITACGPAPYGSYVDYTLNVGTPPSCLPPTAVVVSSITSVSAVVNWTASTTPPTGGYDVYYSTSNTTPTATTTPNTNVATTQANLASLNPASTYYVWVRSRCSSTDQSVWTNTATFGTACAPTPIPFVQNFNTGVLPNCWSNFSTNNTGYTLWSYAGVPDYGTTNNGSTAGTFVWVDASSPYLGVHDVTLQTPQINLTGVTTPMVQFKWFKNHATDATGTTVPAYDNNKLTVMVRDITTSTWDTIFANATNAATWRTVMVNLPASYVGKTIELRFIVDKDVSGNGYFYDNVLLDDVEVKQSTLATSEVGPKGNEIKLYPNPFHDILNISNIDGVSSVLISDLAGRTVKTFVKPTKELNLSDLSKGMYLVTVQYKDGAKKTFKAIKE